MIRFDPPEWKREAICSSVDPEIFFADRAQNYQVAKRICARCPVALVCLQYALENDEEFGVWGGLSERERSRVKVLAGA